MLAVPCSLRGISAPGVTTGALTLCLLTVMIVGTAPAVAQDGDESSSQFWVRYEYQRRVKERLRGFGMLRYEERPDSSRLFGSWNRLTTTGGVSYDVSKRFRAEGGLGLYYTYLPDLTDTFEVRLWQAATVDWPNSPGLVRRYVLHHRFMLEERFKRTGDWDSSLRARYRLSFSIPLNRYTIEPGAFFVPLAAEFFAPVGGDVEEFYSNRSRLTAGLGYVLNKTWSFQARYTAQRAKNSVSGEFHTTDHIVDVRFKTSVRIRDLLKSR